MNVVAVRVEAAIAEAVIETGDREFMTKLGLFLAGNTGLIGRAAIKALCEPTEAMIEEGAFLSLEGDDIVGRQRARNCYRAMIDAALGEG